MHEYARVVQPGAHEAEPALPLPQLAEARAEVALDAAVIEHVPVLGRDGEAGIGGHGVIQSSTARAAALGWETYETL